MASFAQKSQIDKEEIIHDLNNLNYLLSALVKMIDKPPSMPNEVKRLSIRAINATDKLIAKISGNPKAIDASNQEEVSK